MLRACPIVLRWLAACTALCCAADAAAQVAVVTRTPEDRAVAAQLGPLIGEPVSERPEAGDRTIGVLMDDAASWSQRLVVLIDRAEHTVYVLRPRDRSLVGRALSPERLRDSAHDVALAVAELLEWSGVLPAARGRPSPPAAEPAAGGAVDEPLVPTDAAAPPRSALGWGFGADLELAMHPGFEVSLARASISGELQLGRRRGPTWYAFGARLGGPASWDRELPPSQAASGVDQVEYSDFMAGLHAALGYGAGRATVLAQLEGGLNFVRVESFDPDGESVGVHDGPAGFLGLGIGLRYPMVWGLSISAAVQAHWLIAHRTYQALGVAVLEEGPVRVATRIGLIWESALFSGSP